MGKTNGQWMNNDQQIPHSYNKRGGEIPQLKVINDQNFADKSSPKLLLRLDGTAGFQIVLKGRSE